MPTSRKIIFSSYVVPTQSVQMEETSIRQTLFMDSPGSTLSGKGSVTIANTQGDNWTSFNSPKAFWEDQTDNWQTIGETWSGTLNIGTSSGTQLSSSSDNCGFLYVKNTGSTYNASISINGSSGNYYLIIPPKGSLNLKGVRANLVNEEIYAKAIGGTTTIEYIVATSNE